ncbi:hypothetical protein FUAX_22580 [Fulvitalea axinellae]|uniref:Uncharacterized protein n=1 Tax=Fulvitalea axinellae TaxID=1182444 RepID=A0AAU9CLE6_9BACT|nr:hypothetical protein FUAX_22580 [Fulvitalea axinellae]
MSEVAIFVAVVVFLQVLAYRYSGRVFKSDRSGLILFLALTVLVLVPSTVYSVALANNGPMCAFPATFVFALMAILGWPFALAAHFVYRFFFRTKGSTLGHS